MPHPFAQWCADLFLSEFDAVQQRRAAHRRQRPGRIESAVLSCQPCQSGELVLKPPFETANRLVEGGRGYVVLHLRTLAAQQALGIPLLPTKLLAQEQPPMTHRYRMALQGVAG